MNKFLRKTDFAKNCNGVFTRGILLKGRVENNK